VTTARSPTVIQKPSWGSSVSSCSSSCWVSTSVGEPALLRAVPVRPFLSLFCFSLGAYLVDLITSSLVSP
jgi:hypothetical protein